MTVAGQVDLRSATDDQLRTLVDTIRDAFPNELTEPFKVLAEVSRRLTELQHRREAEAGFREFAKLVDESPHPERSAHLSADARAQAAFAMLDNFKRQARALAAVRSLAVGDEGIREDDTIRVCPERDARCPHGMSCPYNHDRYRCDMIGSRAALKDTTHAE